MSFFQWLPRTLQRSEFVVSSSKTGKKQRSESEFEHSAELLNLVIDRFSRPSGSRALASRGLRRYAGFGVVDLEDVSGRARSVQTNSHLTNGGSMSEMVIFPQHPFRTVDAFGFVPPVSLTCRIRST
jgi:hypothetical protein